MTLYEIDEQITSLVDPETGEILDIEAFEQLQMDRAAKLENMGKWIKDLKAEKTALADEIKNLTERKKKTESKIKSLESYLSQMLGEEKFKTAAVYMYVKPSPAAVMLDDDFIQWAMQNRDDLLRYPDPEANKTAIKEAINAGETVEHASLQAGTSLVVK